MARRGRPPKNKVPNTETIVSVEEDQEVEEVQENNGKKDTKVKAAPLADRNQLIKRRFRTGIVTTLMERSFEIKSIDPKTMVLTRGTAFLPAFNDFVAESTPDAMANPEIRDFVTDIVIAGVTSLNLVKKTLEECTEEETPVQVLDLDEQVEIFSAIMELCASEEERAEWKFFPPTIEEPTDDQQPT
tara:strand:- start:199 stop:759 length:561 start_codon:yes stop_codon:yes gene_type:complete